MNYQRKSVANIEVAGIPIIVEKKNIKNIHLYILPPDGRVKATVPFRLCDEKIKEFISSKLDWIKKHTARYNGKQRVTGCGYESGSDIYIWGRRYTLRIVPGSRNETDFSGDEVILSFKPDISDEQKRTVLREWYRKLLKEEAGRILPEWERATGLYCSGWQTKYMKTRWGTCNTSSRKIWLNVWLVKKPVECLEYVILHELAHLRYDNHGKEFKELLDTHMPLWREVEKKMDIIDIDFD